MRRLLCALLLLAPCTAVAQAPELRVVVGESTRAVPGTVLDGAAAYPLDALVALGARVSADATGARAVLHDDTIAFTIGSPFFHAAQGVHQLAYPVHRADGVVHLPEQFFLEWLPRRFPGTIEYNAGALRVSGALALAADAAGSMAPGGRPAVEAGRVVVIDPGHGGRDPGKIGPGGIREKDIVLAIGKRLAAMLRDRGYEVHLTRDRDTLIALGDRPRLANEWKGHRQRALFLSIHANSWRESVRGFETYFLSDARTEDARRVAEMENAAEAFEERPAGDTPEADLILNSLRNDFYVRASNDLAEVVQGSLAAFHTGPNRGVKQAGFRVLIGAFMPAVLVETAFISNPQEARLLATSAFQQKLAWGLAEAIDRFFVQHEHLWSAESP